MSEILSTAGEHFILEVDVLRAEKKFASISTFAYRMLFLLLKLTGKKIRLLSILTQNVNYAAKKSHFDSLVVMVVWSSPSPRATTTIAG